MRLLDWLLGRGTTVTVDEDRIAALALRVAETQAILSDVSWNYSPDFTGTGKKIIDACGGLYSGGSSIERVLSVLATMDRVALDVGLREIDVASAAHKKASERRELLHLAHYLAIDDYRAATGRDRKYPDAVKRRAEIEATFDEWRG